MNFESIKKKSGSFKNCPPPGKGTMESTIRRVTAAKPNSGGNNRPGGRVGVLADGSVEALDTDTSPPFR